MALTLHGGRATWDRAGKAGAVAGGGASNIEWLVTDQLGTPRMGVDQTGTLAGVKRHDYLPFGEEIGGGVGGRTTPAGGVNDVIRQKFTGYERDNETGLDYAQARYYSSALGRFTSPDSLAGSASDPQTLNLYSYVLNNPLRFMDPTGHIPQDPVLPPGYEVYPDDWATNGVHPSYEALLNEVAADSVGSSSDVVLETTPGILATSVSFVGQVASDTAIGAGKSGYNALFGTANLINAPIDYGLSFVTDLQFGPYPLYEASTPGESGAMLAVGIISLGRSGLGGAAGLGRTAAAAEDVLTLGRGPASRLAGLAEREGGSIFSIESQSAKEIFSGSFSRMRQADKIIFHQGGVPGSLDEALQFGGGQFSRAEQFMIKMRPDLLKKTEFK